MADGKKKKKGRRLSASEQKRGPPSNGFESIIEAMPLRCAAENVHPLVLPEEALVFKPAPADVVCVFKNGDKERKIHCNIELDEAEKEALRVLQKEACDQKVAFFPSIAVMATRYLSRARGDPKKALALMQATQAWRMDYFSSGPVSDEQVKEDLKHGIVYFTGRDSALRPTIVVRPRRIPQEWYKLKCIDRMIKVLIFCMEFMLWHMMIPGRIENTNVIVDLKGLGVTQLPIGALSDIYKVMSHHYIGRVFRFYVVNMNWVLNTISGAVKGLLTDRQKQKLVILDNFKDLQNDFALHQLEEDLGGSRPVMQEFFPFNMPPGPFSAKDSSGPKKGAIEGAHALLDNTPVARQGVLWDPSKTKTENTALQYSPEAYDLFQRCNLPIPPDCVPVAVKPEAQETATNGEENPPRRLSKQMRASLREMGICADVVIGISHSEGKGDDTTENNVSPLEANDVDASEEDEDGSDEGAPQEMEDEVVQSSGWLCRSCACAQ